MLPESAAAAEAALERLRDVTDMVAPLPGRWIGNVRDVLGALIASLEGRNEAASEGLARAIDVWRELRLPLDEARTVIDAVTMGAADLLPEGALEAARGERPLGCWDAHQIGRND